MRIDSLRVLLAIMAVKDLECHQVNVNNAFTKLINSEVIYILPSDSISTLKRIALYIIKSLYGLKQAAKD
jgi:hypothetical protein